MPDYDEQSVYNKHQGGCDCEDSSSCGCDTSDCGCCPPGLVGVTDCKGNNIACLTPNDAAEYTTRNHIPEAGLIKVFDPTTGLYLGDMSPTDAIAYLTVVDPSITSPVPLGEFSPATTESVTLAMVTPTGTNTVALDFVVDRLTCEELVAVAISGAPPTGMSFLASSLTAEIPSGVSSLTNGILITDAVNIGVYLLNIAYTSCGSTKVKTLTVNVI